MFRTGLLRKVKVYTSEFLRAQQTTEIAISNFDTGIYVDSRLNEWWKGIFHSMSKEERQKYYPWVEEIKKREGFQFYRPPEGESGFDVERRGIEFLADARGTPLIGGHGRWMGLINRVLTNGEVNKEGKYPNPANCELWKFERQGEYYKKEILFRTVGT